MLFRSKKETNSDATRSQESFLPIDNDGVLLPTKDFKQEDIPNFLIIYAQDVLASDYPKVGMTIADPQIVEAILLCRLINPLRNQKFPKLTSVYVYPSQEAGKGRWKLELTTKGGPRILWGSAPGHEANSEPLANVKLKRLVEVFIDSKLWSSPEVDLISPASWK